MLLIGQITADPLQQQSPLLSDGSQFLLQMYYRPLQYGWFINELTYGDFTLQGLRITNSPNFLYQWRNKIPFGLACYTQGNREPTQQGDFASGQAQLYLLTAAEVAAYEQYLTNGNS